MTPPSLEDFNHAALLRNSAVATQQRRRSSAVGIGGSGSGGIGGVGKLGLSAAVRQQLRQRDSIINRGRHQYGSGGNGGGSRAGSMGKMGGAGGGGGGGGGGGPIVSNSGRFSNRAGRERKRRSGNGSGAGVGVAGGSRLSALGQLGGAGGALVGRDTGVGAEAPGMMEQEERDDEVEGGREEALTDARPAAATSGLRIPLSMISNAGAKANFLAPSSQQQPSSLCPPPPPFGSTPSSPSKKFQTGFSGSSGMYGLGSSGFRDDDHFFMGPGKARRPVSVESSPTRFSSMCGTHESVIGAAAAGAERAGAWKTGEVSPVSPGVPPLPRKSEERKTRESSVVGNEAFL
ncbi:hypothetical protein DBV05_g6997 [Lasiodiplodia theobromae]|uniref:Uncharacterized protein n=1 Tax=Lasiodiplodia theobromae TaxID=45133 RepID=A0A5N5DAN9_9PEZI|nr:hypothetical protein DBV05_g6997 [Lasiodiplodia theobromae]